jgi:HEAT repeat protein
VPEAIDAIAGSFLEGLGDRDTVVRWAAAKALARLAERLPREYARIG